MDDTKTPIPAPPSAVSTIDRMKAALARVGINVQNADEFREVALQHLEDAANAYENATIPADQSFWQKEAVRLSAAIHALI